MTTGSGLRFTVVGVAEVSAVIEESLVFHPSAAVPGEGGYWLVDQPA